ncbi:MAG: DUF1697 domain-containing protein [Sphingosinicella sp.]
MARRVALLRGINVGGRVLPMAELRALAARLGWTEVSTFIASGNLLFVSDLAPAAAEQALEEAIEQRFAMKVPVIVRTRAQMRAYRDGNPFPDAARDTPNWLMLLVPKRPPPADAVEKLQARAQDGEQVGRADDGLWISFVGGVARSKLSPMLIDKLVDSPATSRNYRTVAKLCELLGE